MNSKRYAGLTPYAYFTLFALSGFTGLIYESIWTHYLKLFLGHAAYAQVLVLVIFMGGLAAGSWLAARFGARIRHLLVAYAIVETIIGLFAIGFHDLFDASTRFAYQNILADMQSPSAIVWVQWSLAALLILPQSILLGMTFPFMSAGLIRACPEQSGRTLAVLYFTNCIGAAIGVLVSGFYLVSRYGLETTMQIAGTLNLLLAFGVMLFWSLATRKDAREAVPVNPDVKRNTNTARLLILIALLTGCASFMYELGWIRMLSLVLGTTTHSFELMLSAFILGLAIGGFWIRKHIDRFENPVRVLIIIQVTMGILGLATLVFYNSLFLFMQTLLQALQKNDTGYLFFMLGSHGIALLIMLPATICAGMTLPLVTHILIKDGHGEKSIGSVYAINTLGAILGIVLTVVLIMPYLGLKAVILTGGMVDIAAGLILLLWFREKFGTLFRASLATAGSIALLFTGFGVKLDSTRMASGVYRLEKIRTDREILFHADGRTSSVAFFRTGNYLSISSNGKIEASIADNKLSKDVPTMTLVATIPLAIKPDSREVAVIGMGSGLTTHTLLNYGLLERVDTIEIEPAITRAARLFGKHVANTFSDKRSRIHHEDAKVFFVRRRKKYDLIISEPSQPWVSGVSGLFSQEFYRHAKSYIKKDGYLVQWIHLYHIDLKLISSVIKALSAEFKHYTIYALNHSDIAIVASNHKAIPALTDAPFRYTALRRQMHDIGIHTRHDFGIRLIGTRRSLGPLFNSYRIRANSDYFPVLDHHAPRARFKQESATRLLELRMIPAVVTESLDGNRKITLSGSIHANHFYPHAGKARTAWALWQYYRQPANTRPDKLPPAASALLTRIRRLQTLCGQHDVSRYIAPVLHEAAEGLLPFTGSQQFEIVWNNLFSKACLDNQKEYLRDWYQLYLSVGTRNHQKIIHYSRKLLPERRIETNERNNYLFMLLSNSLGHQGKHKQLQALRLRLVKTARLPIELKMVLSHYAIKNKQTSASD